MVQKARYHDADSFEAVLSRMKFEFCGDKNLVERADRVKNTMAALEFPLNNNQLGVSLCAAYRLENRQHRQIYSVPAGQGKSRIIVGLIATLCSTPRPKFTKFRVVYNHQELMDADRDKIKNICKGVNATVKFQLPGEGHIVSESGDELIIIDEIDYVLLDCKFVLDKHHNANCKIIGLTATAGDEMLPLERNYIETLMKFAIHDSGIKPSAADRVKPTYCELAEFFGEEYDTMGRLIYCDSDDFEMIENETAPPRFANRIHRNVQDLKLLTKIEPGDVFLISLQSLMRGFDYRCAGGLALLICKKVDSERALRQAFSRVGRYDEDACHRFVLTSLQTLEPIDHEKRCKLVSNVNHNIQHTGMTKKQTQKLKTAAGQHTITDFIKKSGLNAPRQ